MKTENYDTFNYANGSTLY